MEIRPLFAPPENTTAPALIQRVAANVLDATEGFLPWAWDASYDPENQTWEVCCWPVPALVDGVNEVVFDAGVIHLDAIFPAFDVIESFTCRDGLLQIEGIAEGQHVWVCVLTAWEGEGLLGEQFDWMYPHLEDIEVALNLTFDPVNLDTLN